MTITILDGGMGQELIARSSREPTPLWSTQALIDEPGLVRAVHDDYFAAGATVATTDTYALLHDRLAPFPGLDQRFEELHTTACQIARDARDAHGQGHVAGSLGPLGWSYVADMAVSEAEAKRQYAEIAALHAPLVDIHLIETMASVTMARAALAGASQTGKPVWLAISVDDTDGTVLRSGEPIADALAMAESGGAAALLINCSVPEAVTQGLRALPETKLVLGAYANGFNGINPDFAKAGTTVDLLTKRTDLGPADYANHAQHWVELGATIIGGCCEVGPAHIAELNRRFALVEAH